MQAKLLELFSQSKSGQAQPAGRFRLIGFSQHNGLRDDFALGFGQHAGMSVLQLALLSTRQQITGVGGKGVASRGFLGIELDRERNAANANVISVDSGRVAVRVMRRDEEWMIAKTVCRVLGLSTELGEST